MKHATILTAAILSLFTWTLPVYAHGTGHTEPITEVARGEVVGVIEEDLELLPPYQVVDVRVLDGTFIDEVIRVDSREMGGEPRVVVEAGDRVVLQVTENVLGEVLAFIVDADRRSALYWMLGALIIGSLLVGGKRGLGWIVGLAFTIWILFGIILPNLTEGGALTGAILGTLLIVLVSVFLSHGFNRTSQNSALAILGGAVAVAVLSRVFVSISHLTGIGSEESGFLLMETPGANLSTLLLVGIVIGALGALDDVAVTQCETVEQLREANPHLSPRELYTRAMRVGHHHLGSIINTLVLAYVGASLPMFVLLYTLQADPMTVIASEQVMEEIVRTVVGTLGLLLTVPIATAVASFRPKR